MGMSTHIVAIKPADEKWKQMKAIWDACEAAGIAHPIEVEKFFNGEHPDDKGVTITLSFDFYEPTSPRNHPALSIYAPDESARQGVDVDLSKLPEDVKIIRFMNSW